MTITSREFLLLLLDVAGDTIESETRVQKLSFLGIKEEGLPDFTYFAWDKYGPFSKELWKTLRTMESQDLLHIDEEVRSTLIGDRYKIRVFMLTDKGRLEASDLGQIHGHELNQVKKLYSKYGRLSLDSLLNYVHTAYSPADL